MTTRAPTIDRTVAKNDECILVTWSGLVNTDDGAPVKLPEYGDKSFQLTGTLGAGGTVLIEGSNDNGTTWATINDKANAALSMNALGMKSSTDRPLMVRPRVSAGDGSTVLAVTCLFTRTTPR